MSLVVFLYPFGTMGALYIELSSCFINKNKLYTWISGTSAEEPKKRKKKRKDIRTCVKRQPDSGYPEREKTGSIILI